MFNPSLLKVLNYRPWRWVDKALGTKQELQGVFILFSNELVTLLKAGLTQAEKDEFQTWVNIYTEAQCAEWHVPVWAGDNQAVYCRVPASVWNDPTTTPPLIVRQRMKHLWQVATN